MESRVQNLLGEYGNLIASYHGVGRLIASDGQDWKCAFQAGQLKCGDVILLCDFFPPLPFLIEIEADKLRESQRRIMRYHLSAG